ICKSLELIRDFSSKNSENGSIGTVISLLEKEIEKQLTARYEKLVTQLQSFEADSLGYGAHYRIYKKDGSLTEKEWREKYPTMKVDFKINVNILNHGELE
ncbi:Ger(x)C family spore germination C-terminal domain-containing protein, partial [Virgibacillus sp. W0430]|uniref:Ger(x)C family spore germination C-terminal domain-containing protein n=1 Tax=Virgibacillus sp. W0430 TaxID=3391580 RepID=UPI003F46961B